MHFAGRNLLGTKYDLTHKNLAFATVLEVGLKVFLSVIIACVLSFNYLVEAINQNYNDYFVLIVIGVAVVVVGIAAYFGYKNKDEV